MTDENTPKTDEAPRADDLPVEAEHEPRLEEEAVTPPSPPMPAAAAEPMPPTAETSSAAEAEEDLETTPLAASTRDDLEEQPPAIVAEASTAAEMPEPESTAAPAETEPAGEAEAALPTEPPAAEAGEKPKTRTKKPRKPRKAAAEAAEDEAAATATATAEPPPETKKKWYAVKVQSGREESIKAAIERKVKIENLEQYYGQIVIPVEEVNEKKKVKVKVKDKKSGEVETTTQERNVVKKIKKFPGYIFAEVEFNDEILYVFRETSGVGDFVGIPARRGQGGERLAPSPMTDAEVQSMLTGVPVPGGPRGGAKKTVVKLDYEKGDKVRIKGGAFAGHEAEVKTITEAKDPTDSPKVTVVVTMWGRGVDVTLDYWEVDKV